MKMEILSVQNQFVHMMPSTKVKGELRWNFPLNFTIDKARVSSERRKNILCNESHVNQTRPSVGFFSLSRKVELYRPRSDSEGSKWCNCAEYFTCDFFQVKAIPAQSVTRVPIPFSGTWKYRLLVLLLFFFHPWEDSLVSLSSDLQGDSLLIVAVTWNSCLNTRKNSSESKLRWIDANSRFVTGKVSPIASHNVWRRFAIFFHTFRLQIKNCSMAARVSTRFFVPTNLSLSSPLTDDAINAK